MKRVIRTTSYSLNLDAIAAQVAKDNPMAALDLWLDIDDQVAKLADPNFPRRPGRVKGTKELVAHKNYIVLLEEDATTVTVLQVVHARQKWPRLE
ncbi:MAG: type II toxin-antitoxin system RelE/ParE family toxin [Rhodoferax sp.]|jgi:toxin ParE1/3/4|uniref:type II toxin-antitoxin system RelE/ParE family toxin n=1 Tax=Rhodoferax sp. TaxID=50421 RepID=UPI001B6E76A7|nr:type II toxin-antitoxin system RelE/ParE family toxin [Rhodoferax sp.]MBP9907235.1 type II toxin-antitoxin system RelE/ParE family toxin [Rhodoferax sp.]